MNKKKANKINLVLNNDSLFRKLILTDAEIKKK